MKRRHYRTIEEQKGLSLTLGTEDRGEMSTEVIQRSVVYRDI